jgi:hypothetical protein
LVCTIIGGGPSLKGYDGGFHGFVIGVNYAWKYFDLDMLVCYDKVPDDFPEHETTTVNGGKWQQKGPYLNKKEGFVSIRNSSVAMAINIAWHMGYRKIYLLGCDGKVSDRFHYYDKGDEFMFNEKRLTTLNRHIEFICDGLDVVAVESILKLPSMTLEEYKNLW